MINTGIVGIGFMAATHIRAYRQVDGVKVAAICDKEESRLTGDLSNVCGNLGDENPVILDMNEVRAYQDFNEMLANPDIHLIDICTPTLSHVPLATAALKAGKHVLCEKPLARSSEQGRQIVEAASESTGYFMPAMCMRFWPGWAWLKEAIADGRYGRLQSAQFSRLSESPGWGQSIYLNGEVSGGALFDLHVHDIDFVQYCFGRPRRVFSTGFSKVSGAIDHVLTQYEVDGGASVSAEGSWAMTSGFGFRMSYLAIFEKATVEFDSSRGEEALKLFAEGQEPEVIHPDTHPDGYVGEIHHLVTSIQQGIPPQVVTAQDALCALEICEAEEKSVMTGRPVEL